MKLPIKEYLSLINAGYTPEEIKEYSDGLTDQTASEQPVIEQPVIEQPEAEPVEKVEEAPKTEQPVNGFDISPLMAELRLLRGDLQRSHIMNDQAKIKPTETAEQVLASVVLPTAKKGADKK